jgi:hypothetical protein
MKRILAFLLIYAGALQAQLPFTLVNANLYQAGNSFSAWGDFDQDGDLDLALTGDNGGTPMTILYRNDSGTFVDVNANLPGVNFSSCEWGDFEPDGDLDLLITGYNSGGIPKTYIIKNNNGVFSESGILFPGVAEGQAAWGDFDNDQDLDILLVGKGIAVIYRNDGNDIFTDIPSPMIPVWGAFCNWVDYNNDGLLDAMIAGDSGSGMITNLYRNEGGIFTEVIISPAPFLGLASGHAEWGDLNGDGRMDMIETGMDVNGDGHILIYQNDGNDQFTEINNYDFQVKLSSLDIGDYDNDGLPDWILVGKIPGCGGTAVTQLYHNEGFMVFFDVSTLIPGISIGSASFGDYNNDGYSDLLINGMNGYDVPKTELYRNNLGNTLFVMNTPPAQPSGLTVTPDGNDIILKWYRSTDAETPTSGLSYNVFLGSQPTIADVFTSMSDLTTGFRHVVTMGNTGQDTTWRIKGMEEGDYYWSVQTIDNGFLASQFSPVESFTFTPVGLPDDDFYGISITPNPATSYISIHGNNITMIEIYSMSGEMKYHGTEPVVNTVAWPAGIYLVKVITESRIWAGRIIKVYQGN